jgi:hypothetical protein
MLANVSPELASSVIGDPILISDHAFRIFVVWLLYRELDCVGQGISTWVDHQKDFAEAWNFGALYNIPAFQNAVMRMIVLGLNENHLDLDAVQEAYCTDMRDTELQQALVMDMVRSCLLDRSFDDHREELEYRCMDKVEGFYPDVATALVDEMDQPGTPLEIDDFLIDESGMVYERPPVEDDLRLDFIPQCFRDTYEDEDLYEDEDSHGDESVTDG